MSLSDFSRKELTKCSVLLECSILYFFVLLKDSEENENKTGVSSSPDKFSDAVLNHVCEMFEKLIAKVNGSFHIEDRQP